MGYQKPASHTGTQTAMTGHAAMSIGMSQTFTRIAPSDKATAVATPMHASFLAVRLRTGFSM